MRRLTDLLRSRAEHERGATMVMVALMLTVLMGFVGLAIDGAAVMAKEQELQNGADAAALAAAQEAARDNCTSSICANAEAVALPYGAGNVRHENGPADLTTTLDFNTPPYTATATVTGTKSHWFMPLLGINSSEVDATATASWGVPVAGHASLPIAISLCSFMNRVDGVETPIDGNITIWMDHPSDPFGDECDEAYPDGGFGWLIPENGKCEADIDASEDGTYGIGYSKPGTPNPNECATDDAFRRAVQSADPVLIPIFEVSPGEGVGAEYIIRQFASFDLKGYEIHNSVGSYPTPTICGRPKPSSELKSCLYGEFVEYLSFADGMALITPPPSAETLAVSLID